MIHTGPFNKRCLAGKIILFLSLCLILLGPGKTTVAYFGAGAFGLYGLGSLYGGTLYGLGGLYGGIFGLYGIGGIYGTGSFYGLYGLGGLGLYGLSGIYGLGGLYGIYGGFGGFGDVFGTIGLLSNLGLLNAPALAVQPVAPVVAEQAGTWSGTWYSLLKLTDVGIMNLTLVEDTINVVLKGEVNLLLNSITNSVPAQVNGPYSGGSTFILSGGNNTVFSSTFLLISPVTLYTIDLNCTLTSPTTMTGTYAIQDLVKVFGSDFGNFNLTLTSPVI